MNIRFIYLPTLCNFERVQNIQINELIKMFCAKQSFFMMKNGYLKCSSKLCLQIVCQHLDSKWQTSVNNFICHNWTRMILEHNQMFLRTLMFVKDLALVYFLKTKNAHSQWVWFCCHLFNLKNHYNKFLLIMYQIFRLESSYDNKGHDRLFNCTKRIEWVWIDHCVQLVESVCSISVFYKW